MCRPCQELSDQEECHLHIPRGQVRGMSLTAEEVGHPMVGGAAFGTGGIIGPAFGVKVGLETRAMAGTELGEGAPV